MTESFNVENDGGPENCFLTFFRIRISFVFRFLYFSSKSFSFHVYSYFVVDLRDLKPENIS